MISDEENDVCVQSRIVNSKAFVGESLWKATLVGAIISLLWSTTSILRYIYYRRKKERLLKRPLSHNFLFFSGVLFYICGSLVEKLISVPCQSYAVVNISMIYLLGSFPLLRTYYFFVQHQYAITARNLEIDGATKTLQMLNKLRSFRYRALLTFLVLVVPLGIFLIWDFYTHPYLQPQYGCRDCSLSKIESRFVIGSSAVILMSTMSIAFKSRKYPDPLGIMTEVRYLTTTGSFVLFFYGLGIAIPVLVTGQNFRVYFLIILFLLLCLSAITDLQVYLSRNEPDIKIPTKQVNSHISRASQNNDVDDAGKSGGMNSMLECLKDQSKSKFFEDHLAGEFSSELVQMLRSVENYESTYYDVPETTRKAKTKRIYTLFIETNSVQEVNLSHAMKDALKHKIIDSNDTPPIDVFKGARIEIYRMLLGSWIRFEKTKLFLRMNITSASGISSTVVPSQQV